MGRPNRVGWFQGKQWGTILEDGTVATPFTYQALERSGDLLIAKQGALYFLIKQDGERISFGYSFIFPSNGGFLIGQELNPGVGQGFLDQRGKVLALPRYAGITPPTYGIITARSGSAWGWINQATGLFLAPEMDLAYVQVLTADLVFGVQAKQQRVVGFRTNGGLVFDIPATDWPEVVGMVLKIPGKDGGVRWVDADGKEVAPLDPRASSIGTSKLINESFYEGGKWGFKDAKGRILVKPILDRPGAFLNGLASPVFNGKQGVMDTSGRWTIQPTFESLSEAGPDGWRVGSKDRKSGVWLRVGPNGDEVTIPGKWSFVEPFDSKGQAIAVEF